jgi:hypothetical protein
MLLQHSFGILFNVIDTWKNIKEQDSKPLIVMMGYVAVMAALGPLAAYYGTTQVGWEISGETYFLSSAVAFQLCLLTYLAILGGITFLGVMINWMAVNYGGAEEIDAKRGITLAGYSVTPVYIASISVMHPSPMMNALIILGGACWAGYLLIKGIEELYGIPEERAVVFSVSILAVALVLLVSSMAITVILWSYGFSLVS